MTLARPALVSEEEFLALPETVERLELLDGEVIMGPSPNPWHQELLARLVVALRAWAATQSGPVFVGMAPLDVRFGPSRILQPDAFVILGSVAMEDEAPLVRIPELCVEVLSTHRAYDRLTKRLVYAAAGVQELWVVEPSGMIERWHGPGLSLAEEIGIEKALTSAVLPGFRLNLEELFRSPLRPGGAEPVGE
jgi:Uma2 family endonuclease